VKNTNSVRRLVVARNEWKGRERWTGGTQRIFKAE
jgi:hypothetical protein